MKSITALPITRAEKTAWAMNNVLTPAYVVTMVSEIDASGLARLRSQIKDQSGSAPSYTALIIKAAGIVIKQNPEANRAILGLPFLKKLFQFKNIDIAVAVEKELPFLPGLAFAPVITDIESKSCLDISKEMLFLKNCTVDNSAQFSQYMKILKKVPAPISNWLINLPYYFPTLWVKYRGCAVWVNAPSKAGVDMVLTSWPWPITFTFGLVKSRPTVVDGKVEARLTIPVTMAFDRRIMGGGPASRIFANFQEVLIHADKNKYFA